MADTPTSPRSLSELAQGLCTDKGTVHSYLEVYDALFAPRRESAARVLEVGVYEGGSIRLWHDYFPAAEVTGLDVSLDANKTDLALPRVRLLTGDAYDHATLARLADRRYDVIVDDGPHTLASMLFVARNYTGLLAPGGVLVIEDVQDAGWVPAIVDAFPSYARGSVRVADRRGVKGRYDDLLVVLDLAAGAGGDDGAPQIMP